MPGFRQRLSHSARSRSPPASSRGVNPRESAQLKSWLSSWAWGRIAAADVVRNAESAVRDGGAAIADSRVSRLARGVHNLGNAERLVEAVLPVTDLCEPVVVPDSSIQCVLLPHLVLPWLQSTNAARFRAHLGGEEGLVQDFWEKFLERPACASFRHLHPWLQGRSPEQLRRHLPLMLFDDTGPVSSVLSSYARSWYSVLGKGGERECRFLICTGLKDEASTDMSWPLILESFRQLAQPKPEGQWGGILLFFGGDLEYTSNTLGLPHHNSAQDMCTLCLANTSDVPHNNFHRDAAWRSTLVDNERYLARVREPRHPLVAHDLFNCHTYRFDLLHMCDHHGVCSHTIGNILWANVSPDRAGNALPGDTVDERIAFLQEDVAAFYSLHRVANRAPPIRLGNIKSDSFPELKGNGFKAANTRALLPYICALQERAVLTNPTSQNKSMLKVATSLQQAYDIMYREGPVMGEEACGNLQECLARFGRHYQMLALQAFQENKTRWKTMPKLHFVVAHLADQARLINPTWVQGYVSESMVGVVGHIYARSQSGPFRHGIQRVVMKKYRTGLHLLWV